MQTRRDGTRRLLVISSWIAHEFDRATEKSLDRLAGKLIRSHENVDGVFIVGRIWNYESDRHSYLINPVVRKACPGGSICMALDQLKTQLDVPPIA